MAHEAQIAHDRSDARQRQVYDWAVSVYGEDKVRSRRYQALRGLEEFLEVIQGQGLTLADIALTAEYVYSRPTGNTKVEIGDVLVSLDIMAENLGLSTDDCLTSAITRIHGLDPEKCRSKDEAKCSKGLI